MDPVGWMGVRCDVVRTSKSYAMECPGLIR